MKYRVSHQTTYQYSSVVSHCYNIAHLSPRSYQRQTCHRINIDVEPAAEVIREQDDFFGNTLTYFSVQHPHKELHVQAVSEVELHPTPVLTEACQNMSWQEVNHILLSGDEAEDIEARQFMLESPLISVSDAIVDYARPSFITGRPLLEAVHDLMQRIHHEYKYDPHFTTLATPLADVVKHQRGVCQDFAHLAIACLISHGLAARYVSGYIETLPPPGKEKLIGADASHAWFSVYFPSCGWLDFDPTNNQIPMDKHITTAWGRDYSDVTPLKGVIFGGGKTHELKVAVDVQALPA